MKLEKRLFGIFTLFALATALSYSQDGKIVVKDVSGVVFLTPAIHPNKRIQLKGNRAVLRPLQAGDVVHCEPHSSIKVIFSGRVRTFTDRDGDIIIQPYRKLTDNEQRVDDAITKLGSPGGSRSIGSLVWWPADGGAVRLENFRVRWNPPSTPEPFKIVISAGPGEQIWSLVGVPSAQGRLTAEQDAEIQRLLQQRQTDAETQNYILTVSSEMQGSLQSNFAVLSRKEEARVGEELREWDKRTQDPLLRVVGRTDTLTSANLYCDVAEELEAALKLAPDSEVILNAALVANQRTGNLARTHALSMRLQAVLSEDAPQPK